LEVVYLGDVYVQEERIAVVPANIIANMNHLFLFPIPANFAVCFTRCQWLSFSLSCCQSAAIKEVNWALGKRAAEIDKLVSHVRVPHSIC